MSCRTILRFFGTLWILCVFLSEASLAHTSISVAVDSNILVFDGKVLFAQGTGSLTMLDLETGGVVLRKSPPDGFEFGGMLCKHKLGIVMANHSRVALLDAETLDVVWSVDESYDAAIGEDHFIAHDGYHTVRCFDIATGKQVWSTSMEAGWQLRAVGNEAVISTPLMYDKGHIVKLFELATGRELFVRQAKDDEQFLNVYFDGDNVYLLTAAKDAPLAQQQSFPTPENLIELGPDGQPLRKIDFQLDSIVGEFGYKTPDHGFFFEDRFFSEEGSVRDAYPHEPAGWAAEWGKKDSFTESVSSGVLVERDFRDITGKVGTLLQLVADEGGWSGYISYFRDAGWIGLYTEAQGSLVFASGRGHVECIDIATGQSRWLYVFPVVDRTMSYSRNGMPPMLTVQAAAYRSGLAKLGAAAGTLAFQKGVDVSSLDLDEFRASTPYLGRIIIDPQPDDPFADVIPKLVYRAAACAAFPVIIMAIVVSITVRHRRQTVNTKGAAATLRSKDYGLCFWLALPLAAFPIMGIMAYGRVDPIIETCLWSVLGLSCVFIFYAGYKAESAG